MNNNDKNQNEVKKQSPYKGIEDPAIRAQYEKEYGMINVRLLVSILLIVVCASAYVFIISDTFGTIKNENKSEEVTPVETEVKQEENVEIDPKNLIVIDNTKPSNGNFVCEANYSIENLDYDKSSFKVPYININSEDAKKVNEEIKENFKTWASESAKFKKKYEEANLNSTQVVKVKYEIYSYQNVLSTVICYTTRVGGMESNQYYSYAFNTTKESIVATSNEEILSMLENTDDSTIAVSNENNYGKLLDYQEIFAKLNLSYEEVDTHYKDILTLYSSENSDADCIDKTLNLYRKEVDDNTLYAFINTKGELNLISKIYTPIYEQGTYRIFRYDGEKFEAASFGTKEASKDEDKEKETLRLLSK